MYNGAGFRTVKNDGGLVQNIVGNILTKNKPFYMENQLNRRELIKMLGVSVVSFHEYFLLSLLLLRLDLNTTSTGCFNLHFKNFWNFSVVRIDSTVL